MLQREPIDLEKVAIMPGTAYGPEGAGFVRLNVGCPRAKEEAGIDALIRALRTTTAAKAAAVTGTTVTDTTVTDTTATAVTEVTTGTVTDATAVAAEEA